jgi:rare lipoprotein A
MLKLNRQTLGKVTQSRTALIVFAAAAFSAGTASEASAGSYHHHHYRHHARAETSPWRQASASLDTPSFGGTGHTFSGMASFYGNESGRKTASGQRFNQEAMTAAHRTLPFGTKLRVTHGGRSVVVTINDRGPFVRGRVLDLSTGAARAIGLTGAGVGRVVAEVM